MRPAGWKKPTACCVAAFVFAARSSMCPMASRSSICPRPTGTGRRRCTAFAWLPALSNAGGDNARRLATNLIGQWIKRHAVYSEPAWLPHVMAKRLAAIFSHSRLVILNSEMTWRSRLFVSLREQSRMLERIADEAPDGLPRLQTAAVLALSGICLTDSPKRREAGLAMLEGEIERQILPDGGHVSRSPEALLSAYHHLVMVLEGLNVTNEEPPHTLRNAHDRMAPMLRFFRHGDGGMALFNGGAEGDPRMIAGLLARDDVRGQPFHHARHSGYQRLTAGRSLLVLDCGKTPEGAFSLARACRRGRLRILLRSRPDHRQLRRGRAGAMEAWSGALRATAAHSTLTLADSPAPASCRRD